ncbi:helix-turn-helix domain-containing protein [Ktedonobacter racemifer]|uniref:Uncharacterized protein n=1 Tax=Ktedonobacter racemifer DSM 44963 TaxID=485913 RepID=D6TKJ3_KTERA|nr:helix-turn-helix domain-containing protein [Ktedonobacter racemifer]EFH86293.1 hypothetical protein Krac_7585 [Ktedonobacter racemifer DSM 44963]
MKNYYTAKEAQERLGLKEGNFFYLVRTGRINKITPPGKKQGVYPRSEIDKFAREMLAFMTYDEGKEVQFMKVQTEDDVKEEYELASLVFGNATHDIPTREAWLKSNPDISFVVRDQGTLVSFIDVLPVKHDTIMRFMNGEIRGWEIPAEDVLTYTPGSEVECIIMSMVTRPDIEPVKRKGYGRKLLSGFLDFIQHLTEKDVQITKLYATSSTPSGIAIMDNAGFDRIGQIGKRVAFEMDTRTSEARIAREYRKILDTHREEQEQGKTHKVSSSGVKNALYTHKEGPGLAR